MRRAWSGSKLFDTLTIFLKVVFKLILKKTEDDKNSAKIPSRQRA